MKNVFVLSGGSIRGAFQAGAIAEILSSGHFIPDAIFGTSVGSLNGAFLSDRAGRATINGDTPNWPEIGKELQQFWLQEITSFEKLGEKRGSLRLLFSIIFDRFDGFVDMSPLYELVNRVIKRENLLQSPTEFYACAVDVATGEAIYANAKDFENIHDYIIASTAIPMVMPVRLIQNNPFVDGGLREVAPLSRAIKQGAEKIYCILCHPKNLEQQHFNRKDAIQLMEALMSIVTNETVNNDINHCKEINELLAHASKPMISGPLQDKRPIDLQIVRPKEPVDLELVSFDQKQIEKALAYGREQSKKLLASLGKSSKRPNGEEPV